MSYEANRRVLGPVVRGLYRMDIRGQQHVPLSGPVVVAANHESLLDALVLAAVIPRPIRFLAKEELWSVPLLRWWLDDVGAIPVGRGRGDRDAIEAATAALEAGEVVGVFPSGGVHRHGPWLRGAARMALLTGSPILPVRLLDTGKALSRGVIGLPRLAALVGEPIAVATGRATVAAARDLTNRLHASVSALGR